jgi:Tol biopolymer transport system component
MSPDGKRFLFIRFHPGTGANREPNKMTALFIENMNGTHLRQITPYGLTAAHEDIWAAWSPNGHEILSVAAGHAHRPGPITCFDSIGACMATRSQLIAMRPDGSHLHVIPLQTPNLGTNYRVIQPTWSPDGSRILFCLWPTEGDEDIYTANKDGTKVTQLTHTTDFEYAPRWG